MLYTSGKVSLVKFMLRSTGSGPVNKVLPPTVRILFNQLMLGAGANGNTPIHLCCEMLASSSQDLTQRRNKYIRCLNQLLYFITARQQDPAAHDVVPIRSASG